MRAVVTPLKFHPVNASHGYAVEKVNEQYRVVFAEKRSVNNNTVYLKEGNAHSRGRLHSYDTIYQADYVIRYEILPLYKESQKR